MALRDYCNIILFIISIWGTALTQTTEVKCINPEFDQLVNNYLEYSVPTITVADAYESKLNFVFLDARELEEYKTSHIQNAIHVGFDNFKLESLVPEIRKEDPIIIYCSIGYRSEKIGAILKANGYQNVFNLYGSIFEWVNQHHPVVDINGKSSSSLHTFNKKWSKWVENEDIKKIW